MMLKKNIAIAALCIAVAGIGIALGWNIYKKPEANATESVAETMNEAPAETTAAGTNTMEATAETPPAATEADDRIVVDVEAAMAERALGDPDAPVVIKEFASLSCSHCAHFSNETFDQVKEEYIDTGKVRFIYNDFPLNAPALDAAIVARCLPEGRYFKFIKFLFETQEQWAFERNYRQKLLQNAKLVGGNGAKLEACLESEELRQAVAGKRQEYAHKYEVQSTPSFVLNEEHHIRGAQRFPTFKETIDKLLEKRDVSE